MSKITLNDLQNPLYLHPSDGPTIIVVEKLKGASDYRAWKRSMEISFASKQKLGFVTGVIERDVEDREKQEQWDTCNNLIIAWILNNMSPNMVRISRTQNLDNTPENEKQKIKKKVPPAALKQSSCKNSEKLGALSQLLRLCILKRAKSS